MHPVVVAAFRDRRAAESAAEHLRNTGIGTRDIRVHRSTSDVSNAGAVEADELLTGGLLGNGMRLLNELFGTHAKATEATDYDELVRREATLVSVQVETSDAAQQVSRLLSAEGAERVATLPQAGLEV